MTIFEGQMVIPFDEKQDREIRSQFRYQRVLYSPGPWRVKNHFLFYKSCLVIVTPHGDVTLRKESLRPLLPNTNLEDWM